MTLDLWSGCVFAALFLAASVAVFRAPRWALVALIVAGPCPFSRYIGGTTLTPGKVVLVACTAALVIRFARQRERHALRAVLRDPLFWCAAALVAATALSAVAAADRIAVVRETFKALQYLAVFGVAFVLARIDPDARLGFSALAVTTALVALGALTDLVLGVHSVLLVGDAVVPRVAGALEGPNQLAGYLGLALPAVAAGALSGADVLTSTALALGLPALVLSLSRAGIVTTLLALGIVFSFARSRARPVLVTAVAAGVVGVLALGGLSWYFARSAGALEHLLSGAEAANPGGVGTRTELWSGAIVLWQRHPLLGVGAGNFETEVGPLEHLPIRTHANSWFLQSLVEGGLPLFAAAVATVAVALVRFARDVVRNPWTLGAFAATVGFALHQVVDDLVFYPAVGTLWWLILGVAAALEVPSRSPLRSR